MIQHSARNTCHENGEKTDKNHSDVPVAWEKLVFKMQGKWYCWFCAYSCAQMHVVISLEFSFCDCKDLGYIFLPTFVRVPYVSVLPPIQTFINNFVNSISIFKDVWTAVAFFAYVSEAIKQFISDISHFFLKFCWKVLWCYNDKCGIRAYLTQYGYADCRVRFRDTVSSQNLISQTLWWILTDTITSMTEHCIIFL